MISVSTALKNALEAASNSPLDLYELQLDSGTVYWSTEAITWGGNAYEPVVLRRSPIRRYMTRQFDQVRLEADNVDTGVAQLLLANPIEGRRLIIRKIDRTVAGDSVVTFHGVMRRAASIDRNRAVIEAVELLGSMDDLNGRPMVQQCTISEFKGAICRYAGAETECDRSISRCAELANTNSFFGIRFLEHQGTYQYSETQIKSFLFFFRRKKRVNRTATFNSVDETPRGAAVPTVYGRPVTPAITLYHVDTGGVTKALAVFSTGPIHQIDWLRANDKLVAEWTGHQGELGGLGNQLVDPRIPILDYPLSGLAYVTLDIPSDAAQVDASPIVSGLVSGRQVRHFTTGGVFTTFGWDDNAALAAADYLMLELDHGGMGLSPADLNLQSVGLSAAYCDEAISDTTGGTRIFRPENLPPGVTVGAEYKRWQPSGVTGKAPTDDGPYLTYVAGVDDDLDRTPPAVNVKRFTCNLVVGDRRSKIDVLDQMLTAWRGFHRYDKDGKIELLAEKANPNQLLTAPAGIGANSLSVADSSVFVAGDTLIVGALTAAAEIAAVSSVGAGVVNLSAPLAEAHSTGDEVLKVSMALNDSVLIGDIEYPLSGRAPGYNQVQVTYVDAPAGFEETPLQINDYVDQVRRRKVEPLEVDGAAIDNYFQAWRIGQTQLAKSRDFAKWVSLRMDMKGVRLEVGDVVAVSSGEHGLKNVPFRIEEKSDLENHEVELIGRAYASGLYDDVAPRTTLTIPAVFNPILPGDVDLLAPGPVDTISLVSLTQDLEDPTLARIEIAYNPPSSLNNFDGVEVQLELPEAAEVDPVGYALGPLLPQGWHQSDGSDDSRVVLRVPYPTRAERWHVYLLSRNPTATAAFVHRGDPSPSPSLAVNVPKNPGAPLAPNVTGVAVSLEQKILLTRARSQSPGSILRITWTLPTGDPNYERLLDLSLKYVKVSTDEEEDIVTLPVFHASDLPQHHLSGQIPSPDVSTDYKVRIYARNFEGRITPSPAESGIIALGPVATAPAVTSPGVSVEYKQLGNIPHYRYVFSWTLPTGHPDYDDFSRVDIEGRPVGETNWSVFAREGEESVGVTTDYWRRPDQNVNWEFRFVSINAAGLRGAEAAVGPVTVTAQSGAAAVTGWSVARTTGINEAGIEMWGLAGNWTNPADTAFDGVEIVGVYVGESEERLYAREREGSTSFVTDQWPMPEAEFQIDVTAISINRDGKRGGSSSTTRLTITPGGGGLRLDRADPATIGLGLEIEAGELKLPTVLQGVQYLLTQAADTQLTFIDPDFGLRQKDNGSDHEVQLFNGELKVHVTTNFQGVTISADPQVQLVNAGGAVKVQIDIGGSGSALLDPQRVRFNNVSGFVGALLTHIAGGAWQSGAGTLLLYNSAGAEKVALGTLTTGAAVVRLDGNQYVITSATGGLKQKAGQAILSSGGASIAHGMATVTAVLLTERNSTPTGDLYSWTLNGGGDQVLIQSDNIFSTEFVSYLIIGT